MADKKEYIERGALIEFVKQNTPNIDGDTTMQCVERAMKAAPAADVVEVRHGEWEQTTEPCGWHDVDCVVCSACGESWILDGDFDFDVVKDFWNYCPACGAKMDGERKDKP